MKVAIIGWYGTETIGDRGILAGIVGLLGELDAELEIHLGSLYPFYSERMLHEDTELMQELGNVKITWNLFDSRKDKALDVAISQTDYLIMGGGPLMHIHTMFMVEYAFRKAKKLGKKTIIFGCGVGPLEKKMHQKCLMRIFKHSDAIILRDSLSEKYFQKVTNAIGASTDFNFKIAIDPSVKALLAFKQRDYYSDEQEPYIAFNLREFPAEYAKQDIGEQVHRRLKNTINSVCEKYTSHKVRLIPMHYFHIGGDDRIYLNELKFDLEQANLEVQNVPLSLLQTMIMYRDAEINIGMRFHSVVFQTMVNGKNLILDYTDPELGKIGGFINDIGGKEFYQDRYMNLQSLTGNINFEQPVAEFIPDANLLNQRLSVYTDTLKNEL